MTQLTCFKAYDIRGRVPDELNEDVAYRVGRAFVEFLNAKRVVVGHDIRLTSDELTNALAKGITDAGADVVHIGQCGTEEVYFGAFSLDVDGGICVTASHNPIEWNALKFIGADGMFLDADAVVKAIEVVDDSMFYREGHRRLYRAMVKLWEQGEVIDAVTLVQPGPPAAAQLAERGPFDQTQRFLEVGDLVLLDHAADADDSKEMAGVIGGCQ